MYLKYSPPPNFIFSAKKVFEPDELHITRICDKSILILMTDGILRFREDGRDVELREGEYYIQRHHLLQEGVRLGELPVYYFIEFFGSYSEDDPDGEYLPLRGEYRRDEVLPTAERFERMYSSHRLNHFEINSFMHHIFGSLMPERARGNESERILGMIRGDIEARFAENMTIDELASRYGYTSDYVTKLFREKYGTTPHRYRIRLRMEHARWLIGNTTMGLVQIAESVGYRDFSAFYRQYRTTFGVSPAELRKS